MTRSLLSRTVVAGFDDDDNSNTTRPSLSYVPESLSGEKKNKRANGVEWREQRTAVIIGASS